MAFLIIVCVLLAIGLGLSIYGNINLMRKFEASEENHAVTQAESEKLELWINSFTTTVKDINQKMMELDRKGSFESDDEIGFFFKEIKKLNEDLKLFV